MFDYLSANQSFWFYLRSCLLQPGSVFSSSSARFTNARVGFFVSLVHSAFSKGQGVGCARAFWGRKSTHMVLGQGRKYTRMVLARVARVTASSVHAVRGLICTRGQGPRLYTRNGCCMYVHLCSYSCVFCVLHVCRLSGSKQCFLDMCKVCTEEVHSVAL